MERELAHMIMEAWLNPESAEDAGRLETQRRVTVKGQRSSSDRIPHSFRGSQYFSLKIFN